jgi:hypothetical protein
MEYWRDVAARLFNKHEFCIRDEEMLIEYGVGMLLMG